MLGGEIDSAKSASLMLPMPLRVMPLLVPVIGML
jgi:hypothetical protein